jgi:metal-responsive CopG/Arc/MetJ family transcriptional regulator
MKADKAKKKQYVNLLFDDALMKRIDDFRFKNRFPSRTEAVRWLLSWALRQKPTVTDRT